MVAGLLAVACGDDDAESPSPSRNPSCDELSELESYRFALNLMLDAPVFGDGPTASPVEPLDEFSEALSALFEDLRLEGAHVAPDRTEVSLTFEGEELVWRSIGNDSWVLFDDEWEAQVSSEGDNVLTPEVVCEDIVEDLAESLDEATVEEETINGVPSHHYVIDREDISELPDLLGGGSPEVPDELNFDLWLAQNGSWPVKISVSATDTDEEGQPVTLSLDVELDDVNDATISIEEPELGPGDG